MFKFTLVYLRQNKKAMMGGADHPKGVAKKEMPMMYYAVKIYQILIPSYKSH